MDAFSVLLEKLLPRMRLCQASIVVSIYFYLSAAFADGETNRRGHLTLRNRCEVEGRDQGVASLSIRVPLSVRTDRSSGAPSR